MNEGGGLQVFDLSGNGKVGIFQGTAPSWTAGQFGSAILLPGTDEHINTSAFIPRLNGMEENGLTIAIWFKVTGAKGLATQGYGNNDWGSYGLFGTGGKARISAYAAGVAYRQATSSTSINDDNWHFIVGKVDRSTAKVHIFVDGIEEATDDWLATDSFETAAGNYKDFAIGALEKASLVNVSTGLFDLPMIWNRALSAGEIAELYAKPFCMLERRARTALISGYEVGVPPTGIVVLRRRRAG